TRYYKTEDETDEFLSYEELIKHIKDNSYFGRGSLPELSTLFDETTGSLILDKQIIRINFVYSFLTLRLVKCNI
ncbi:hypothetical protein, partial [Nostoc sp.]